MAGQRAKSGYMTLQQLSELSGYHRGSLWRMTQAPDGVQWKAEIAAHWLGRNLLGITDEEAKRWMRYKIIELGHKPPPDGATLRQLGTRLRQVRRGDR